MQYSIQRILYVLEMSAILPNALIVAYLKLITSYTLTNKTNPFDGLIIADTSQTQARWRACGLSSTN